ncbi:MAG TPA: hypothetical protein VFX64_02195 [Candidatus Nitrosotalea sp.]|nr:hypothetical protein [Candidatus Nitrosotalea sp.]
MLIRHNIKKYKTRKNGVKRKMGKPMHRLSESPVKIDKRHAIEITAKFLEQHHSIGAATAVLKGTEWFVTMSVGMSKNDIREVRIDANTGKILGYT